MAENAPKRGKIEKALDKLENAVLAAAEHLKKTSDEIADNVLELQRSIHEGLDAPGPRKKLRALEAEVKTLRRSSKRELGALRRSAERHRKALTKAAGRVAKIVAKAQPKDAKVAAEAKVAAKPAPEKPSPAKPAVREPAVAARKRTAVKKQRIAPRIRREDPSEPSA